MSKQIFEGLFPLLKFFFWLVNVDIDLEVLSFRPLYKVEYYPS